jgi:hypothetical protein
MLLPWFGVVVNQDVEPEMIVSYRPGGFVPTDPAFRPATTGGQRLRLPSLPPLISPEISREILKARERF